MFSYAEVAEGLAGQVPRWRHKARWLHSLKGGKTASRVARQPQSASWYIDHHILSFSEKNKLHSVFLPDDHCPFPLTGILLEDGR
jgi:hypothetical protein